VTLTLVFSGFSFSTVAFKSFRVGILKPVPDVVPANVVLIAAESSCEPELYFSSFSVNIDCEEIAFEISSFFIIVGSVFFFILLK